MKKKILKVLALVACAVLLVVGSIAGTLAFLTDKTDAVKNTFTVGKIDITLDETDVDLYGVADGTARVTENKYKLIPSHNYVKDPTIHVTAGSEVCYLFVKVENGIKNIEATDNTIADQMATNWTVIDAANGIYAYNKTVDARDGAQDITVFSSFTIGDDANVANYVDAKVNVTAYAVQADGFADAVEEDGVVAVWNATFGK